MLQNLVYIDKKSHRYFNRETGQELISWSRFIENFFPKFDSRKISAMCAGKGKYAGMSQDDVLAEWDGKRNAAADHGTRIHDTLEYFSKNFKIKPGCEDLEPMVLSVFAEYKEYSKIYPEEVLYYSDILAGTPDNIFFVDHTPNSPFDIEDFKTNLDKGIEFVPSKKVKEKWCLYPIEHLPNCSYTKYALQLSMYAYMFECISGRKCRQLRIRFIPPEDKLRHICIPVPYLKNDVMNMIAEYENIKLNVKEPEIFSLAEEL